MLAERNSKGHIIAFIVVEYWKVKNKDYTTKKKCMHMYTLQWLLWQFMPFVTVGVMSHTFLLLILVLCCILILKRGKQLMLDRGIFFFFMFAVRITELKVFDFMASTACESWLHSQHKFMNAATWNITVWLESHKQIVYQSHWCSQVVWRRPGRCVVWNCCKSACVNQYMFFVHAFVKLLKALLQARWLSPMWPSQYHAAHTIQNA